MRLTKSQGSALSSAFHFGELPEGHVATVVKRRLHDMRLLTFSVRGGWQLTYNGLIALQYHCMEKDAASGCIAYALDRREIDAYVAKADLVRGHGYKWNDYKEA